MYELLVSRFQKKVQLVELHPCPFPPYPMILKNCLNYLDIDIDIDFCLINLNMSELRQILYLSI